LGGEAAYPVDMKTTAAAFTRLIQDERGATAIEYTLIAGLIGLSIIVVATLIGEDVKRFLTMADAGLKV